jgi:hypothetical protein
MYFGTEDHLRPIQDVAFKGPKGEALYLGYKFSYHCFILPYSVSDEGYVLGVKGTDTTYYRLTKAQIEQLQASGQLPSPLPSYQLSTSDYVMGHMLCAFPVFIAGFYALRRKGWK